MAIISEDSEDNFQNKIYFIRITEINVLNDIEFLEELGTQKCLLFRVGVEQVTSCARASPLDQTSTEGTSEVTGSNIIERSKKMSAFYFRLRRYSI